MARNENETKLTVLFGLARHSNRKIQQPRKYFGRRTNFTSILIVVSHERHALQKTFQTIPV